MLEAFDKKDAFGGYCGEWTQSYLSIRGMVASIINAELPRPPDVSFSEKYFQHLRWINNQDYCLKRET
jgi:hypothetical protein